MQKPVSRANGAVLAAMLVIAGQACASGAHPAAGVSGGRSEPEPHAAEHHMHWNHAAAFVGGTSPLGRSTHFTLGAEYVRNLSRDLRWAIGGFGEAIFAEHTEWVVGWLLYYRPVPRLGIRGGPGFEFIQEETSEHPTGKNPTYARAADEHETRTKTEFLFRVGVGYEFGLRRLTITPTIDYDAIGRADDALVWGVTLGLGF